MMMNRRILTPKERIVKVNQIQRDAVKALIDVDFNGTLKMCTGIGKTVTAFKSIYAARKLGKIKTGDTVRFWGETEVREKTIFEDEAQKALQILGPDYNILEDFNCVFRCYQAGLGIPYYEERLDVKFEVYDEIDFALTEIRRKTIEDSTAPYKLGLTATNSDTINVLKSELNEAFHDKVRQQDSDTKEGNITALINKGQLLDIILPVCFEYNLSQGVEDGVLSGFETIVINHFLDTVKPYVSKSKSNPNKEFLTERDFYNRKEYIRTKREKVAGKWQYKYPAYLRNISVHAQSNLLYSLESKVPVVKAIKYLVGDKKTLIFNPRLDILAKITDNVCDKDNDVFELVEKFNTGEINDIASAKKLKRGISLVDPEVLIIVGYYKKSTDLEQMLGRMLRYSYGSIKRIYILRTEGTFEVKWFDQFTKVYNDRNQVEREIDLNIVREFTSNEVISLAKKKYQQQKLKT